MSLELFSPKFLMPSAIFIKEMFVIGILNLKIYYMILS